MRGIAAVAVNTIRQILRLKIVVVFIILLAVMLAVMGLKTTGDGTIKGRLQTFISYGLSLVSLLLCLLTIIASVYTVTSDISGRQIFTVVTKPIRRFEILAGKFSGVIILDFVLLVLFSSVIYFTTVMTPHFAGASEEDMALLDNEFFTARAGLRPQPVDVTAIVEQTYKDLLAKGQITREQDQDEPSRRLIIEELTQSKEQASRSVSVGRAIVWKFNNVNIKSKDPNSFLFVRFKYEVSVTPPDSMINGIWTVGDQRDIKLGQRPKTPSYQSFRRDKISAFHEIAVPANAVAPDGYVEVEFVNPPSSNDTVVVFPPDGLEVLYKADSFTANFIRSVILIFLRLFFLTSLGIFTASFLSMPTALLFSLIVFSVATVSGFIFESFGTLSREAGYIYNISIIPLMHLLPQFDKIEPSAFLVSSRLLSWSFLGWAALVIICIQSLVLFLLGIWVFSRREIAKIIV